MDVGLYISELLKEQSEVSLPGIGIFKKKRKPALFDKGKGVFHPPSYELVFLNSSNVAVSESLVSYIQSSKNISEPSAIYFIEKYSDSVRHALMTNGTANIHYVGTLKNSESGYLFTPLEGTLSTDAFGLAPVSDIKVTFSQDRKTGQTELRAPAADPVAAAEEPLKRSQKVWPVVLVVAVLLLLSSAAAVYFYRPELLYSVFPGLKSKQPAKVIVATKPTPKTLQDSMATADSIVAMLQQEGFEVEKPKDTVNIKTTATAQADTTRKEAPTRYEIITASFNRQSEAENYVKIMRKKGFGAEIVEDTRKPKFKVSIGSFTNNEAAQKEKRRIHAEVTKEAWILTINDNNK